MSQTRAERASRSYSSGSSSRGAHSASRHSRSSQQAYDEAESQQPNVSRAHRHEHEAVADHASSASYSRDAARYRAAKHGMSLGKKIAIGLSTTLVVALAAVGIAAGVWYYNISQSLSGGTDEEITNVVEEDENEPYYVLVLGSDSRSEDGSGSRSDSMMVVRVDEENQQVSLLSIPRDLYVYMGDHGYQKINAATAYGGYDYAIEIVNQLLGIEISYYVFVYFSGFEDLVDSLGGVTVEVPEGTYYNGVWVEAGDAVEIDGEEALVLARCRKGYPEGTGAYAKGDYQRTINQRNLVKAIAKKVLDSDVSDFPDIIEAAVECVDTNMSATRLLTLAKNMKGMDVDAMESAQVPVAGATDGEAWVACMYEDVFEVMLANFTSGNTLTDGIEGFDDEYVNATTEDYVQGEYYWYTMYETKYGSFEAAEDDENDSSESDEESSEADD